jgi:hypothetical protein
VVYQGKQVYRRLCLALCLPKPSQLEPANQPHDVVMAEGFELTQLQQLETAQLKLLEFQFN